METIEVAVMVTLQVESIDPDERIDRHEARVSVARAVQSAIAFCEDNGFTHPLEDKLSIGVACTELLPE